MGETLMQSLYQQDTKKPFRYYRTVTIATKSVRVIVDFLTGENQAVADGRTQIVQDVTASAMHGCDLAFLDPVEMEFTGQHPGGGQDTVTVRVASITAFVVMKGLALHNRGGDDGRKDACDICYCIRNFPGGIEALATRFQPYLSNALVQEGLTKIAANLLLWNISARNLFRIGPMVRKSALCFVVTLMSKSTRFWNGWISNRRQVSRAAYLVPVSSRSASRQRRSLRFCPCGR